MPINKRDFIRDFYLPKETIKGERLSETRIDSQKFRASTADRLFGVGINVNRTDAPVFYELDGDGVGFKPFPAKFGSAEFWDKAQMGRLLAYPAGEKHPVQLQFNGASWDFSRPVAELPHPKPPAPQRMSRWHRFLNVISFGNAYKAERQEDNRRLADHQKEVSAWQKRRDDFAKAGGERTDEKLTNEVQNYEKETARKAEKARRERAEQEKAALAADVARMTKDNPEYDLDQYRQTYQELTGPKPVIRQEWIGQGGSKYYYTQEEADSLKTYELPREPGKGGVVVTDRDFGALTLMAATFDEIGGQLHKERKPTISVEANKSIQSTIWTETMVGEKTAPRHDNGFVLPQVYQPARAKVHEAVTEYHDTGDPQKLGRIIAEGSAFYLHSFGGRPLSGDKVDWYLPTMSMVGESVALLDKDPKLMEAALAAKGKDGKPLLTKKDLDTARGMTLAADLKRRNEKAEIMLKGDAAGVVKLTPEEKKKYVHDRVLYATVNRAAQDDITSQEKSEAYTSKDKEINERRGAAYAKIAALQGSGASPEAVTAAEHEAQEIEAENDLHVSRDVKVPQVYTAMGAAGEKGMDALVQAQLPGAERLYDMPTKDLVGALEPKALFAPNSPAMKAPDEGEKVQQPKERVVEPDKTLGQ